MKNVILFSFLVLALISPKAFGQQVHDIDALIKKALRVAVKNARTDSKESGVSLLTGRLVERAAGDFFVIDGCSKSKEEDPGCHVDLLPHVGEAAGIAPILPNNTCPRVDSPAYVNKSWANVEEGEVYCVKTKDGGFYGIIKVEQILGREGMRIALLVVGRQNLVSFDQGPAIRKP